MKRNLLIVGAGSYGVVAYEIAVETGLFEKIGFIDDSRDKTANGKDVVGKISDLDRLSEEYDSVVVAVGDPMFRVDMIERIKRSLPYHIETLISPRAYISPSAQIMEGCIVEPMAVVHTGCLISQGCIISAGAVINHESMCNSGVHIDCNATVEGYSTVPKCAKLPCGEVFSKNSGYKYLRTDDTYDFDVGM